MRHGFGLTALILTFGSGAFAQGAAFKDVPKGHWAGEAVGKMSAMGVLVPDKKAGSGAAFDGSKPVTRYELAMTLWRFAQYLERTDKQKRGKTQAQAPKSGADAVKALIAGGYLPKSTPLAKDGGKTVTAAQLSDALTMVIVKVRAMKVPITPDSEHAPIARPNSAT
jgi:uncharacterized membrane protein